MVLSHCLFIFSVKNDKNDILFMLQAILLSKLDFEEKKDVYKQTKKDAEIEKKVNEQNAKAGSKKQKKKNVMSLDQFNDMMNVGEDSNMKCKFIQLPSNAFQFCFVYRRFVNNYPI